MIQQYQSRQTTTAPKVQKSTWGSVLERFPTLRKP